MARHVLSNPSWHEDDEDDDHGDEDFAGGDYGS